MKSHYADDSNKALVERLTAEYNERGMDTFAFEWTGTRVPETVTFPDGSQRKVNYMRDGIFLFADRTSATYERLDDIYPQQPQSVLIAYVPTQKKQE